MYDLFVCVFVIVICLSVTMGQTTLDILCTQTICDDLIEDDGCEAPVARHCSINNATHRGLELPSLSMCNCCEYCMPFILEDDYCSTGGTQFRPDIGRCAEGLACLPNETGMPTCQRMESVCHSWQDEWTHSRELGTIGPLALRPTCDDKGRAGPRSCVRGHTCFCQDEDGQRIFGERFNSGMNMEATMQCECSRFHARMNEHFASAMPPMGPLCAADGGYAPLQCFSETCFCVDSITGDIVGNVVNDTAHNIRGLPCYDEEEHEEYLEGNFLTPCQEEREKTIEAHLVAEADGFDISFSRVTPFCNPDGSYMAVQDIDNNNRRICTRANGTRLGDYEASANTLAYSDMDCKCARARDLITISQLSSDLPQCCPNGNFRPIQCHRGRCRCVDENGLHTSHDVNDINLTTLSCSTFNWITCNQ